VKGIIIKVDSLDIGEGQEQESLAAVRNACTSCMLNLYSESDPCLMEPIFAYFASVPEKDMSDVLGDLSGRRRGDILSVDSAPHGRMSIKARVPAIELLSYSKTLRSITAGHGTFSVAFDRYEVLS